ncbi:hypothetical protein ANN_17200 [Periplaneta americana]|uniref:Uncharacterized protein n=1 Tax=Periplaneta americana TaxID=6978 RepID=A0ABQ8SS97_PERAM|nr:hypothetical protein ANN_17200 [Periplaneta americana]
MLEKFKYLGAAVTNINDTREEIKHRINMGNSCYYSVEKLLSSSLLSKNLKVRIYETVTLPFVLYGCETWTLTLREENRLRVFENKVLRKIFKAKRDEVTGEWRKLHNAELHALYSSPDIIRNIKSRRLRWAGHVARMGESRNAYRVLVERPEGKRPLRRPRRRWEDNIKMDLTEMGYDEVVSTEHAGASVSYPQKTQCTMVHPVAASGYALYLSLLHDGAHGTAPRTLCTFQRDARTCKLVSKSETEVTGGQEGRKEARLTGNMCPGVELTDEGVYGLCLRVVSKMTPSQVPKEMIWYMSENCQDAGSRRCSS